MELVEGLDTNMNMMLFWHLQNDSRILDMIQAIGFNCSKILTRILNTPHYP